MLRTFKNTFKRMWEEIEGQDLVEYALLIIMVSLLAVAAMKNLASGISNAYGKAATQLNTATGGGGNGNNGNGNGNNGKP
jgi:Flp pilus assembly pilin Flp